jgi:MFS family permease
MAGMSSVFPLWVLPWTGEFGVPRSTVMLTYALAGIATTLLMPFVGRLLVHCSARVLMMIGALVMGGGFLVMGVVTAYWQVAVVYSLSASVGMVLCGPLTSQSVAFRRFPNLVGAIGGATMVSLALGAMLMPLLIAPVLTHTSWRIAMPLAGALMVVIIPAAAWLFLKDTPAKPGGAQAAAGGDAHSGGSQAMTTRQILATGAFWMILLGVLPIMATLNAVKANIVPYFADMGVGVSQASYVLSSMSGGAAVGALLVGWLADRMDARWMMTAVAAVVALGLLSLVGQANFLLLSAGLTAMGVAVGGVVPLMGIFIVRSFGPHGYGPAAGLMGPFMIPAVFGPAVAGLVRDQTGSYEMVFLLAIPVIALGALATWRLKRRPPAPAASVVAPVSSLAR